MALRKPGKGEASKFGGWEGEASTRTQLAVIMLTERVCAWAGTARPLFHRSGGEEQVYLPNLAHGAGRYRSNYAILLST